MHKGTKKRVSLLLFFLLSLRRKTTIMILGISFICVGVSFVLTGVAIFYFAEKRNDTHNAIMSLLHEKAHADIVRILKQRWKHYTQRCMLCLKLSGAIAICGVVLSCIGCVENISSKKKTKRDYQHNSTHRRTPQHVIAF